MEAAEEALETTAREYELDAMDEYDLRVEEQEGDNA